MEGQCGVKEFHPVLLRPMAVEGLDGRDVKALDCGRSHSAAVTAAGESWTWGEGKEGKLGHGCTDNMFVPARVEALVGRAEVRGVALGRHHTLFMDGGGRVWSCGENREGQCGLGTPLQQLAHQRRQEWDKGAGAHGGGSGGGGQLQGGGAARGEVAAGQEGGDRGRGGMAAVPAAAQQTQQQSNYEQQQFERSVEYYAQHGWHSTNLLPFLDHTTRAQEVEQAQRLFDDRLRLSVASGRSAWQRYLAADSGAELSIAGLVPGQVATPVPVGRDRQALMSTASLFDPGLEAESVVSLASCRYFSAVATAAGGVWTFGGGFNGELGGGSSWSSAARPVEGLVAQLIRDNGGAVNVAAGGSFCSALTASGRVLLWGQPRGAVQGSGRGGAAGEAGRGSGGEGAELQLPHMRARKQGGLLVAEFLDLPPMVHLAAGYSHLLMSDGSRVWQLGRSSPLEGGGGADGEVPWLQPQAVLDAGDAAVAAVEAGGFCSGAVTGEGALLMWGTLLEKKAAEALLVRAAHEGHGHWAYSGTAGGAGQLDPSDWDDWAGLHSNTPTPVPGLSAGVKSVALGTAHALAVVS